MSKEPMKQLMLFYDKAADAKQQRRVLMGMIKERLESDKTMGGLKLERLKITAKISTLKEAILEEYKGEIDKVEYLKEEIKMQQENQNEEAVQLLLKGELENIIKADVEYRPEFKVKWVKVDPNETVRGKIADNQHHNRTEKKIRKIADAIGQLSPLGQEITKVIIKQI